MTTDGFKFPGKKKKQEFLTFWLLLCQCSWACILESLCFLLGDRPNSLNDKHFIAQINLISKIELFEYDKCTKIKFK